MGLNHGKEVRAFLCILKNIRFWDRAAFCTFFCNDKWYESLRPFITVGIFKSICSLFPLVLELADDSRHSCNSCFCSAVSLRYSFRLWYLKETPVVTTLDLILEEYIKDIWAPLWREELFLCFLVTGSCGRRQVAVALKLYHFSVVRSSSVQTRSMADWSEASVVSMASNR